MIKHQIAWKGNKMTKKNKNRAIGRQVRKMIAAAMAAMLLFTSANVTDADAAETEVAVSENAVTAEKGVVDAEKNTGEPEVENSGAENSEAENIDLEVETADLDAETADAHTYENGFCTDSGCSAYEPLRELGVLGELRTLPHTKKATEAAFFRGFINICRACLLAQSCCPTLPPNTPVQ